jgi:hypothetical protein
MSHLVQLGGQAGGGLCPAKHLLQILQLLLVTMVVVMVQMLLLAMAV